MKPTLDAPEGTVTLAGTVTALLLLDRFTPKPPVPAAPVSVTVQASVPAPVSVPLLQLNPLSAAEPWWRDAALASEGIANKIRIVSGWRR